MEKWKNFIFFEDLKEALFWNRDFLVQEKKFYLALNQEFERNSVSLLKFYSFGIRKKENSKEALLLKMNQEFERNSFY